jgi:hypothetical protein
VRYLSSSDALLTFQTLEKAFPELKESEDEKMIKSIKEAVEYYWSDDTQAKNDIIAWLEKQGKAKPTPKFKIGDIIHKIGENTVFPMTIEKIEDGDYVCNNGHPFVKTENGDYVCNNGRSFVNIDFQDDYELVEQKPTDNVELQPKQEWSVEDEKISNAIYESIDFLCLESFGVSEDEVVAWLKSPKHNWKPKGGKFYE